MEINTADALEYITEKFRAEGDFAFIPEDDLHKVVASLLQIDNGYMSEAGVYDGGIYDEDEAYEMLSKGIQASFPQYKMYAMRITEDYMDFAEEYLASIDAIDWE